MNTDRAKVEAILGIDSSSLLRGLKSARNIDKVDRIMKLLKEARIDELEWAEHNADDVNYSIQERIKQLKEGK